jgi:RNA polymerase sigma-70 factor, ECF subfamily
MLIAATKSGRTASSLVALPLTVDPRIAAFLGGDRQAGEALLLGLLPRVRNVVRALIGRDADVDDIAQQTMVHVIRGLGGYRGESPLVGWVDRITVRVTLAHVRRVRARGGAEVCLTDDIATPAATSPFGNAGERYTQKRELVALLERLPEPQKNAVVLHHALGFTVAEIAEEEVASVETVRSRLRMALKKLRYWSDAPDESARSAAANEVAP